MRFDLSKISRRFSPNGENSFLKSKFFVFLLCVLVAFVFWVLNALTYNYSTTIDYPVVYKGKIKNKIVVSKLPTNVQIKIRGSGFDLLSYSFGLNRDDVEIDLFKLSPYFNNRNEAAIPTMQIIKDDAIKTDKTLKIEEIYPESIYFKLDDAKHKKVKVNLLKDFSFENQYMQYDSIKITPAYVNISGPASIIDTIKSINTTPLVLKGINKNVSRFITIQNDSAGEISISPKRVKVSMAVEQYTEGKITLPINVNGLPFNLSMRTFPNKVNVTYHVPLNKSQTVNQHLFKATVNYQQDNNKSTQTLNVNVTTKDPHIEVLYIKPDRVEYILRKK